MSHIIAVRHGATFNGSLDGPLSKEGHEQMLRVAEALTSISNDFYVVSSDKLRSRMGAEIIIDQLGIDDYDVEPRLSQEIKSSKARLVAADIAVTYRKNGKNILFIGHLDFIREYGIHIYSMYGERFNTDVNLGEGFHADMGRDLRFYFPNSR